MPTPNSPDSDEQWTTVAGPEPKQSQYETIPKAGDDQWVNIARGPVELQGPTQPKPLVSLAKEPSPAQKEENLLRLSPTPSIVAPQQIGKQMALADTSTPVPDLFDRGAVVKGLETAAAPIMKGAEFVGENVIKPVRLGAAQELAETAKAANMVGPIGRLVSRPLAAASQLVASNPADTASQVPSALQYAIPGPVGGALKDFYSKPIPNEVINMARGFVSDENIPLLFGVGELGTIKGLLPRLAETAIAAGFSAQNLAGLSHWWDAFEIAKRKGDWNSVQRLMVHGVGQLALTSFGLLGTVHGVKGLKAEAPIAPKDIFSAGEALKDVLPEGKGPVPPVSDRGRSASEIRNPPTEEEQAKLALAQPDRGDWIPAIRMQDGTIHEGQPKEPHISMAERLGLDVKQAKDTGWKNTKTGEYTTEIPTETVKEPGQIYEEPGLKGTPQEKADQIVAGVKLDEFTARSIINLQSQDPETAFRWFVEDARSKGVPENQLMEAWTQLQDQLFKHQQLDESLFESIEEGEVVPGKFGEPIQRNPPASPEMQKAINKHLGDLAGVDFDSIPPEKSLPEMLKFLQERYGYKAPIRLFLGEKDVQVSRSEPNKLGGYDIHLPKDSLNAAALLHEFFHATGDITDEHLLTNDQLVQKFLDDNKPGTDLNSRMIPITDAMLKGSKEIWNQVTDKLLAPMAHAPAQLKNIMSSFLGDRNKNRGAFVGQQVLQRVRDYIEKRNNPDLDIYEMDQVRAGKVDEIKDPIVQALHQMSRSVEDRIYKATKLYKDIPYMPNYEYWMWRTPPNHPLIDRGPVSAELAGMARNPIQGAQRWTHKRYYEFIKEGMADGGIPWSTNQVDLLGAHYQDVGRFLAAQKLLESSKDLGLAIYVKDGENSPIADYRPLNSDRTGGRTFGDAWSWENGRHIRNGRYFFHPVEAQALDNFLSQDYWRQGPVGKYMGMPLLAFKNSVTQLELGMNMFHGVFITNEAMASRVGHGLATLWNQGVGGLLRDVNDYTHGRPVNAPLEPLKAVKDGLLTLLGAPKTGVLDIATTGKDLFRYIRNPTEFTNTLKGQELQKKLAKFGFDTPRQAIDLLFQSGSPVGQSMEYRTKFAKGFMDSMDKGNVAGALLRAYPALVEQVSKPLFDYYIPQAKYNMFFHEFAARMKYADATYGPGGMDYRTIAREAWRAVEDRFGEMSFDQFFWNNTAKSTMQFLARSLTWRLGSMHQMAQSFKTQGMEITRWIHDGADANGVFIPRLTPDMAWLVGQVMVHAAETAILGYAMNHQWPQKAEDWLFAKTGYKDNKGHDIRLSPATYAPMFYYATHDPWEWFMGGASTAIRPLRSAIVGHNYYGEHVGLDEPGSIFKEAIPVPFSVQSFERLSDAGVPFNIAMLPFMGATKTPAWVDKSNLEKSLEGMMDTGTRRTAEEAFRGGVASRTEQAIRYGIPEYAQKQLDALKGADLNPRKKAQILRDSFKYSYYSYIIKHVPDGRIPDLLNSFMKDATLEEWHKLAPELAPRVSASFKGVPPSQMQDLNDLWKEFFRRMKAAQQYLKKL